MVLSKKNMKQAETAAVVVSGAAHAATGLGTNILASVPAAYVNYLLIGVGLLTARVGYRMYKRG